MPAKFLRKQPINRRVLLALMPCLFGGIYYFGWRSLAMVLFAGAVGFTVEYIFNRKRKQPVSEAVFVTTTIFALVMPPTVGWHVLGIGTIFAVMFGKEVFGGYGKNIFNPAMVGRCFVYVCFPVALTATWAPAADYPLGALAKWSTATDGQGTEYITGASPMGKLKAGAIKLSDTEEATGNIPFQVEQGDSVEVKRSALFKGLLAGNISGTMGVTSAALILIGGLYLFITKTASRATILATVITYALINEILYYFGIDPVPGAGAAVLGGGFLFGAFFMATDPVSSPKTTEARIIYGIIIGTCTTVIRNFSIFNGGLMFSILIGNMFAPILDYAVKSYKAGRKEKVESA
jgi:Na+-transporting NADH:ubiquinone oxidoreductase subunit B